MTAIFKREFKSYFTSFLGYVFMSVFFVFFSLFFVLINVRYGMSNIDMDLQNLLLILLFLLPALTSKLFAEDRKTKADQLLFTSPASPTSIVFGKYLAAIAVYGLTLLVSFVYPIIICFLTNPYWPVIINSYLGFFLVGAAFIAVCMFASSITANQTIAFMLGFGSILFLWIIEFFDNLLPEGILKTILGFVMLIKQYENFTSGTLKLSIVVYYLSVAAVFIVLTVRSLEKRRWRG